MASLRALEAGIRYPIADGADHFTIDHGPAYHPFFSRLGEAHFLLAVEGGQVVGSIAGVLRPVAGGARSVPALYLCDLKLAASFRGKGLARRMLQRGVIEILKNPLGRKVRLLYGAAMRGAAGDVMRTARGGNPLRLGVGIAALRLYFATAAQLAALEGPGPRAPEGPGLALSPGGPAVVETTGEKDFRLDSTGKPWRLVHLAAAPTDGWGAWLRECAGRVGGGQLGCFAVDARLDAHQRWLAAAGLTPGAGCTVYGLALTRAVSATRWVHLSTAEI